MDARCEVRARSPAEDRRGRPHRREARSVPARRRRPLDGRRRRRAVLRRGSPLQGRAQSRRHSAVRHDDRYADAGAVPDGVFGRAGRAGASDIIYRRSASKYYRVDVKDTLHLDFTDMNFWGGPLRQRGAYGKIDPGRRRNHAAAKATRNRPVEDMAISSTPSTARSWASRHRAGRTSSARATSSGRRRPGPSHAGRGCRAREPGISKPCRRAKDSSSDTRGSSPWVYGP